MLSSWRPLVLSNNRLKNEPGFTIIEVLIVLAIAALILILVLIAVPTLQRNTRNKGRKDDAYRLLAALDDCLSSHNNSTSRCSNPANLNLLPSEFSEYTGIHYGVAPPANPADCGPGGVLPQCPPSLTQPNYLFGETCNATGTFNGPPLDGAIYVSYVIEANNNGGTMNRCIGDTL